MPFAVHHTPHDTRPLGIRLRGNLSRMILKNYDGLSLDPIWHVY